MRTKEEIQKEIEFSETTSSSNEYSSNEYLFLEVLVDIRDQLDKIRDQLTRTI